MYGERFMHGNKKERAPKQAPQPAETVKQQEKAAEQPADKAEAAVPEGKPQDNPAAKESTKKAAAAESADQPDNPDGSKEEGATTPEASKGAGKHRLRQRRRGQPSLPRITSRPTF